MSRTRSRNCVYIGDSRIFGSSSSLGRVTNPLPLQVEALLASPYRGKSTRLGTDDMGGAVNLGVHGQLLATIAGAASQVEKFRPDVIYMNAAINDIANSSTVTAGDSASNTLLSLMQGYVSSLCTTWHGYGAIVAWETTFTCAGLNAGMVDLLARWNTWLRTQTGVTIDRLSDVASDSHFAAYGNLTYWDSDGTHLTNAGIAIQATYAVAQVH